MKTKVKIPAKINLTLDVTGSENNYHMIRSLCASVGLYDTVTVKKRPDNAITITETRIKSGVPVTENNAFKAAKLFKETFHVPGVDVTIDKNIPVGGGLGGSSADVAAVLIAMNKLFKINAELRPLADSIGSDASYMLKGGYAVLRGRGEKITYLPIKTVLNVILITADKGMSAKEAYKLYDDLKTYSEPTTVAAAKYLKNGEVDKLCGMLKNDLYRPVLTKLPEIEANINALKSVGGLNAAMSGSGSVAYGIFESAKKMKLAEKELLKTYKKENVIALKTVPSE